MFMSKLSVNRSVNKWVSAARHSNTAAEIISYIDNNFAITQICLSPCSLFTLSLNHRHLTQPATATRGAQHELIFYFFFTSCFDLCSALVWPSTHHVRTQLFDCMPCILLCTRIYCIFSVPNFGLGRPFRFFGLFINS